MRGDRRQSDLRWRAHRATNRPSVMECALETYVTLLTSVTPIQFIRNTESNMSAKPFAISALDL